MTRVWRAYVWGSFPLMAPSYVRAGPLACVNAPPTADAVSQGRGAPEGPLAGVGTAGAWRATTG